MSLNYKCLASQAIDVYMNDKLKCINCYPTTCESFNYCLELLNEKPYWYNRMKEIDFWGKIGEEWNNLTNIYCNILDKYEEDLNIDDTEDGIFFRQLLYSFAKTKPTPSWVNLYDFYDTDEKKNINFNIESDDDNGNDNIEGDNIESGSDNDYDNDDGDNENDNDDGDNIESGNDGESGNDYDEGDNIESGSESGNDYDDGDNDGESSSDFDYYLNKCKQLKQVFEEKIKQNDISMSDLDSLFSLIHQNFIIVRNITVPEKEQTQRDKNFNVEIKVFTEWYEKWLPRFLVDGKIRSLNKQQ